MANPSNVLSLAERLKAKIEADRTEIEALTSAELKQLAESLRQQSSGALHSTASAIDSDLQSVQKKLNEQSMALKSILRGLEGEFRSLGFLTIKSWLKPLLMGLSLCAGIFLGSLGMMRWLSWSIEGQMKQRELLQMELEELQRIRSQAEAWGLEFTEDSNGRFLVLPKGSKPEADWTCGKRPCVRLGKR